MIIELEFKHQITLYNIQVVPEIHAKSMQFQSKDFCIPVPTGKGNIWAHLGGLSLVPTGKGNIWAHLGRLSLVKQGCHVI